MNVRIRPVDRPAGAPPLAEAALVLRDLGRAALNQQPTATNQTKEQPCTSST